MKVWLHVTLQILGFVGSAGTLVLPQIPDKYKPFIVLAISAAQGLLAWFNHYYNPDGTPAAVAYKESK